MIMNTGDEMERIFVHEVCYCENSVFEAKTFRGKNSDNSRYRNERKCTEVGILII